MEIKLQIFEIRKVDDRFADEKAIADEAIN